MSSLVKQEKGRRGRGVATKSQLCVICKDSFECSLNYKGQKFACWNCRMSSEALERGFTCPITNTIMFNPTVASDGHCYEKHAIQVWIATAVDNEKRPLSPVTGLPLANLVLKKDKKMLKEIEQWVVTNKLQQHPDRVKPPKTTDIEQRQRDISTQAAQWLTEATPGKQERPGATETTDMTEYAAQSARRRKEEIAAGADLALAVRAAREIADLLKELDCVRSDDTLATAIGSSIDFLPPNAVNDCFYICRERNRIVHESSAGDELRDVQRFRSAVQRARREIQTQIDIQDSYKLPPPAPVPPPRSPSTISSPSLTSSPSTLSSISTSSPVVRRPATSVVSKTPSPFTKRLASSVSPSTVATSSSAGSPWTPSPADSSGAPAFIDTFNRGVHHFHRGEYPQAIAVLTDFTQRVDGKVYPNRLALAKSTIAMAKSRPEALKKANDAFRSNKIREAFCYYQTLASGGRDRQVLFEEDCYAMVMFRMGACCNAKASIPFFSKALKKEPRNDVFLRHRAQAYTELEDFKSAEADLESIKLARVDTPRTAKGVRRQPATVSPAASTPSPVVKRPPAFLETFNNGVNHFNKGEYPQAIKVLTDFTERVDGSVYPNRLANAKRTISEAKTRPKFLKKADDLFCKGKIRKAFDVYRILMRLVRFEEDCYAMVMFRMGACCTAETGIDKFSNALKKEPGNGIFLHRRAQAYMKVEDFKSAIADLESIDLATLDAPLAQVVTADLEICKTQTDPMYKRGHLEEDEIDELMKRFGLED